ncbi:MAG: hypothetical protein R3F14_41150 [Polyangiaceae bacterium]
MRPSSIRGLAVAMAILAFSAGALADEPGPAEEKRRTELFREGKALSEADKWDEAVVKFREVVAIRTASKALLALAVAERNVGNLVAARRAAMEAVALAEKAGSEEREEKQAALESIRVSDERLCIVTLVLPVEVSAPEVLVDERAALVDGARVFVDPGARKVLVRAAGREPFVSEITAKEGERRSLSVVFPAGKKEPVTKEKAGVPVGPIVLGAGGLVAAGAGFALLGTGSAALRDAYGACSGPAQEGGAKQCPMSAKPAIESGSAQLYAGDALVAVGGAAVLGAGAWWLATSLGGGAKEPAAAFIVAPLPGGAVVQASGRF